MLTCGLTWSNAATISEATMSDALDGAYEQGRADERAEIASALWTHIEPLVTWIAGVNAQRTRGDDV